MMRGKFVSRLLMAGALAIGGSAVTTMSATSASADPPCLSQASSFFFYKDHMFNTYKVIATNCSLYPQKLRIMKRDRTQTFCQLVPGKGQATFWVGLTAPLKVVIC